MALPERQRAALVLRFYLDVPDDQAADLLGCRPGTVRSLVSRGLDGLRRKVGGLQ
jgi:DNA-directed RNA polymerase specialized sigma24 family protein